MTAIPDVRWGRTGGTMSKIGTAFASTKAGSWTIRKTMPLDRKILLRTGGRRTLFGPLGAPMLVLETTGRKSGQARQSPLIFAPEGESVIVVGSNFGQAKHPAWTGNLIAHPDATIVTGGKRIGVRATLLEGTEAEEAYGKLVGLTAVYAEYKSRTDRAIRVFRLTSLD